MIVDFDTQFNVVQFNGGLNNQTSTNDSSEANLDNQYIIGISSPTPITEFSVGGRGPLVVDGDQPDPANSQNEPYLDFLVSLMALPNEQIPNVISISYGENEQEIPRAYAMQVCNMFAQLGARGKTVIFASGDSGVGDFCLSNDGSNRTTLNSQFPSSCPYVTSVGGTASIAPEKAVFFSSGGFSDVWPRPAYQDAAVSAYLSKIGDKNKGLFNASGRAFPDVSAQSNNFAVVDQGKLGLVRGTSAAAPVFAGVVAMLNSARVSQGMPPMGFMNPVSRFNPLFEINHCQIIVLTDKQWLYSTGASAMNDITTGASTGCNGLTRFNGRPNGSPVIPGASWNATDGWDPVSGVGTPDFGKMLNLSTPGVPNSGGVRKRSWVR